MWCSHSPVLGLQADVRHVVEYEALEHGNCELMLRAVDGIVSRQRASAHLIGRGCYCVKNNLMSYCGVEDHERVSAHTRVYTYDYAFA